MDINNVVVYINWRRLYTFASRQALLGFCFDCIERLGKDYPEELKKSDRTRLADNLDGEGATDSQAEYEGEWSCC